MGEDSIVRADAVEEEEHESSEIVRAFKVAKKGKGERKEPLTWRPSTLTDQMRVLAL